MQTSAGWQGPVNTLSTTNRQPPGSGTDHNYQPAVSSVSLLELQLRRRDRKNRRFLLNSSSNEPLSEEVSLKDIEVPDLQTPVKEAVSKSIPSSNQIKAKRSADDVAKDLESWIQGFASLDTINSSCQCGMPSQVSKTAPSIEPYPSLDGLDFEYQGGKDKERRFHGKGSIEFENGCYITGEWRNGKRNGLFRMDSNGEFTFLEGTYVDGKLAGRVRLHLKSGEFIIGHAKESVLHGFCRRYDKNRRLQFLGMYRNGVPFGTCWKLIEGGGITVGRVDTDGTWTGPNIAYIYPDFSSALLGQFSDGDIVAVQAVTVTGLDIEYGCVCVPVFSALHGEIFGREVSTTEWMTKNIFLEDPYEARTVHVALSLTPGAEDGLFASRCLKKGSIVAFYNGLRKLKPPSGSSTWQLKDNAYKIFDPTNKKGVIDIPEEYRSIEKYRASLAHKTNHSFNPNCEFSDYNHPRWGLVPCLVTNRQVEKDEELTVTYGYDLDWCPEWYADAWEKEFTRQDDTEEEVLKSG